MDLDDPLLSFEMELHVGTGDNPNHCSSYRTRMLKLREDWRNGGGGEAIHRDQTPPSFPNSPQCLDLGVSLATRMVTPATEHR